MATFNSFQDFTINYKIVGMSRNAIKFRHYGNGELVYVHRNLINKSQDWERYEIVEIRDHLDRPTKWVKATFSSTF